MIKLNPNLNVYGPDIPIWELGQKGGRTRPIDRDILFKNMLEVKEVLEKYSIKYCLSHGTILGIYRDGDLIPWDDDVDIALLDISQRNIVAIDCRKELIDKGFFIPKLGDKNKPVIGVGVEPNMPWYDTVLIKDGEKIEGWWFDRVTHNEEGFYIYDEPRSGWDLKHEAKYYDTLSTISWRGTIWPCPNYIEDYMVMMYSSSWRRPQKDRKYNNQYRNQ